MQKSLAKFYQKFREDLTPILLKPFQKIAEEDKPNAFYEVTITLTPKPDKNPGFLQGSLIICKSM